MRARNIPEGTRVEVRWEDSTFARGWHYPNDGGEYDFGNERHIADAMGYVALTTPHLLVLTGCRDRGGGVLNPLFLPWGMISEIAELRR